MKRNSFLSMALAIVVLSSCGKDDEKVNQLDASEAKASVRLMQSDLRTDVVDMFEADGSAAIMNLSDLVSDFDQVFDGRVQFEKADLKKIMLKKAYDFKTVFVPAKQIKNGRTTEGEDGFNYTTHLGIYEWDAALADFTKTGSSNIIEIRFPEAGATTNNVVLKITEYQEQQVDNGYNYFYNPDTYELDSTQAYGYYPTIIAAEVSINAVKQIGLNFTMNYTTEGTPKGGAIQLFLNPFDYAIAYQEEGSTVSRFTSSIKKNTAIIIENNYRLVFSDVQKSAIQSIDGYSQIRAYKIAGNARNTGGEDPNEFTNFALYLGSDKIGDIVYVKEIMDDGFGTDTSYEPYVRYKDGSQEKLADIFAPVIEELEAYLEEFGNV